MPTERLYYSDSFLLSFEARVLSLQKVEGKFHAILNRTAFYPTGGGQPNDRGTLNGADVVDVFEREENGEVVHVLNSTIAGDRVKGQINWPRRLDHMQQHSGQHVLSAAFVKVCDAPTVGFHLGVDTSTIDLQTTQSIPDRLDEVVRLANQIFFDDRPLTVMNVTREEAAAMSLRKETEREGALRVIDIPDFDRTPCGGTHVARTGQVGLIFTRKVERYKQGWRVEFVCGGRALKCAQKDFSLLTQASKLLSSAFEQIPALVEKQIEESKSSRREKSKLLDELAAFKAKEVLGEAKQVGNLRVLSKTFQQEDLEFVKMLARHAVAQSGVVALFALATGKPQLVFATSSDSGADASQLFKACAKSFPLRGGGSQNLAQGSLEEASRLSAVLQAAIEACERR